MTADDAIRIAGQARARLGLDAYDPAGAQLRLIEVMADQPIETPPQAPGAIFDVLAWVVRLTHQAQFADLAIDDTSGQLLRLRMSR